MLGKYRGGTAGFPFMRIPRFPESILAATKNLELLVLLPAVLPGHKDTTSFLLGSEIPRALP